MPLAPPVIDDRRYQQLVDETLARVPVHTPEWTNFNHSDPGVTLVQLFAFLTENLLYRANQIPERNRVKFLQLLGVPLAPASEARGLVAINNERGPVRTQTLAVRSRAARRRGCRSAPSSDSTCCRSRRASTSSAVSPRRRRPWSTTTGCSTPPIRPRCRSTRSSTKPSRSIARWSIGSISRPTRSTARCGSPLLGRKGDQGPDPNDPWKPVRDELGGHTLTLGLVPALDAVQARLAAAGRSVPGDLLAFELPQLTTGGAIVRDASGRPQPRYRQLDPRTDVDLLTTPGVVQLTLPAADDIRMWNDLEPLEAGVGDLPPSLDDSSLAERLITWLRVRATGAARARVLWVGVNTVPVRQRERIVAEPLADGDGAPDQVRRLARAPVLAGSIEVVTEAGTEMRRWSEIDDLMAAGPEVPIRDDRLAPGVPPPLSAPTDVFAADHEAGLLTFGDGLRGRRLPLGARVFASYAFCQGAAGNVAPQAINSAPLLPSGFTVTNPVRTWGGADAEIGRRRREADQALPAAS